MKLPLLMARNSKALAFTRLAISPRGLYRNEDCSTKLLRMHVRIMSVIFTHYAA